MNRKYIYFKILVLTLNYLKAVSTSFFWPKLVPSALKPQARYYVIQLLFAKLQKITTNKV